MIALSCVNNKRIALKSLFSQNNTSYICLMTFLASAIKSQLIRLMFVEVHWRLAMNTFGHSGFESLHRIKLLNGFSLLINILRVLV